MTIGRSIWDDFGPNQDWPMAAAVAVVMVVMLIAPIDAAAPPRRRAGRGA